MNETPSVEAAARALDGSIQAELAAMEAALRAEMVRCDRLRTGAAFVNGLAAAAQTWKRDLTVLADKIREESALVSAAILGKEPVAITETINAGLADAVSGEKRKTKPQTEGERA